MICHCISSLNRFALAELLEEFLAADESASITLDDEIGGKHGCRNLAAVSAVTDESVNESGLRSGLH